MSSRRRPRCRRASGLSKSGRRRYAGRGDSGRCPPRRSRRVLPTTTREPSSDTSRAAVPGPLIVEPVRVGRDDLGGPGVEVALVDRQRAFNSGRLVLPGRAEDEVRAVTRHVPADDAGGSRFAGRFGPCHPRCRGASVHPHRQVRAEPREARVADAGAAEGEIVQLFVGVEQRRAEGGFVRHAVRGEADVARRPSVIGPFGDIGIDAVVRWAAGDARNRAEVEAVENTVLGARDRPRTASGRE